MKSELRWIQRLQNLNKAFALLDAACDRSEYDELSRGGLIQFYEFTFELAWKTMKDKLTLDGHDVQSPRDTIKVAFSVGLIEEADTWLIALDKRNMFAHTYDEVIAEQSVKLIKEEYFPILQSLVTHLNSLAS